MLNSVLKRYPGLTEADVTLRDDGNGVYVEQWKSINPEPTSEEIRMWYEEDMANYVPSKSLEEQLTEEKAKTGRLETQLNQTNADLQGFMDFYFMNQPQ